MKAFMEEEMPEDKEVKNSWINYNVIESHRAHTPRQLLFFISSNLASAYENKHRYRMHTLSRTALSGDFKASRKLTKSALKRIIRG